ncbi:PPOX class F420-dependent oxidoreductase [Hoyosella sp. YIM 151337]|uniref:PPOX class F420-dependent oxidoreductase n=1 Tax=Hoyosella sp. YIM 151337 TaxID=2992742 RepID=UPI002235EFB6|nr:PPOX class F420-dependent oxidoreductase [Hoyosella sp. YIM 151337]MCW4352910.1 PPOX class F420-dependent oxidoreductase [Hoyosella sp. YIM 151337]
MPQPPLPSDAAEMFARPNYATISSVRPDGQPVSVPTWYLFEDGRVLVNMDAGRKRLEYLRSDPRVSVSAMDPDDWITHVSVQGRVVEFADDEGLRDIDRIARHYTGQQYPVRDRPRVSAWIEIDRWHGWGRLRAQGG